jgi:hypothetical protein
MKRSIVEEFELRHVRLYENPWGGWSPWARFGCGALKHGSAQVDTDGAPTVIDQRDERPTGSASQIHRDGGVVGRRASDLLSDLEDDATIELQEGMPMMKRVVVARDMGLRDVIPGPFGYAGGKLPGGT